MSKFDYPEEVEQRHMDILDAVEGIDIARLRELVEAYKDGRVTIKPKPAPKKIPKDVYTDDDLRYAAYARCVCGAGLAYPKGYDLRDVHCFSCSDLLKGIKRPGVMHTEPLPFVFYEIKTEDQPSACGATTRTKQEAALAGDGEDHAN